MSLTTFLQFVAQLDWSGATLGAVVSGVFAGSLAAARAYHRRRPLRAFLGKLADPDVPVALVVRDMWSADGRYYSWELPGAQPRYWHGFRVVGEPDVAVISEVVNLLGRAGRSGGFEWRSIENVLTRWNQPLISVGGNLKTERVVELCEPRLVEFKFPDRFVTTEGSEFSISDGYDYGLIYRGFHPQTKQPALIVFGFGVAGTRGAGDFLVREAHRLAAIYAGNSFAVIVRSRPVDGPESAEAVWMSRTVSWNRLLVAPGTLFRYRKLLHPRAAG